MADQESSEPVKTCKTCGETKPVAAFPPNRRECRPCRTAYLKALRHGVRRGSQVSLVNGTHKVCSKCGDLKPLADFRPVSGPGRRPDARRAECKACAAHYDATYHAAHPDLRPVLWQRYYLAHLPVMLQRARMHYHANKERRKLLHKLWNSANPDKVLAYCTRRRRLLGTLPFALSAEDIRFCRQYFHYACAVCERENAFRTIIALDHWIPLDAADCPGTVATNILPLCHGDNGCNNSKGAKDPFIWLKERFGTRKARTILQRIETYFAVVRTRHEIMHSAP